jgi:hypothetical protein
MVDGIGRAFRHAALGSPGSAAERRNTMNAYVAEWIAETHAADLRREADHARLVAEARGSKPVAGATRPSPRPTPLDRFVMRIRRVAA